jgi:glycosyltransferase involved in cell wall biosynthesis
MHIGFDISQTGSGKAGCGYFAHAMIKAMLELAPQQQYSLFPSFGGFYFDMQMPIWNPYARNNLKIEMHYGPRHMSRETAKNFWTQANVETEIGNPEIVHANNFWCPVQLVSSRLIYTLYDLGFMADSRWSTEANRLGCFEGVFKSALVADWVIAISEASRIHYLQTFPNFPEERIRVIYPCSRFTDIFAKGKKPAALKHAIAGKFWLTVGTIEPRKNQRMLAKAYARYLALGGLPMPLVFAGGKGWLMDDFKQELDSLGIAEHVKMLNYVSDEELIWLYRNCYANMYPSLFEGFGLPVLEGMQFGAATISSNTTSLPEIVEDAAVLLDPDDVEGWAQAMLQLSVNSMEKTRLGVAALQQAQKFDAKQSAAALLELYEEAIKLPKRLVVNEGTLV